MTIVMAQQGWQCPNCGNIISPNMMWCPFCSGEKKVTYTTTTTEPNSSEKPNNCEPQKHDWHDDCNTCRWQEDNACTIPCCDYESKDEPQTEQGKCPFDDEIPCEWVCPNSKTDCAWK